MVIVYWPAYLESDYCKKEIKAMLDIESKRRQLLPAELRGCRLFIPVILHGNLADLPGDVSANCHSLDYKAQATKPNFNMGDDENMSKRLFCIAKYIKSLCDKMKKLDAQLFGQCQQFGFPEQQNPELREAIQPPPPQPFPGR
jgi:hypothetical protein